MRAPPETWLERPRGRPRTWSATDWASDLVPLLAYGIVVKTAMDALDR
jgi:hypothetical protein